ncbi:hypothetical protein QC761_611130 [Podospora bellae-mahoneyi]|uniref:Uncharacterized protein n=1 Tax=Podospora bellae-mahoneyi TaxID=2093777 RepID=A0ABR0FBD5_9PEZI|nr:hypothetical protein QC761_611130 [Podospora bellae-mahoneyi]
MRSLFLFPIIWHLALAASVRSIFLFKDVMKSNTTALKTSGFNTLIMFGLGILSNGDIMYYSNTPGNQDVRVGSGGVYVGSDALAQKVRSLKTGETGVTRLEISRNAQNVRNLIMTPGPEPETPFSVAFGRMLGQIGYKYTIAPYTNAQFWLNVKNQLNQGLKEQNWLLDRVYLQCYDGEAYNNPPEWQTFLGLKVVPLIWVINDVKPVYGATAAQARTRLTQWHPQSTLAGGGYWNDYDIEKMGLSYRDYCNVLTSIFP